MYRRRMFLSTVILFLIYCIFYSSFPDGMPLRNKDIFAGNILESEKKLYSQFNEELIIRDFFNDRRGGVFVDVGCADYKELSTTYYLEKHLGWSGIAVDALAEFALGYIENRPNTRFFNFIVTDHSWDIKPFYRMSGATAISTVDLEASKSYAKQFNIPEKYQVVYVPTITLNDLLEKNGISKIDFLSMDPGTGEMQILAGFDIKRFKPKLVCIEGGPREEILDYFSRNNYERIEKYDKYDQLSWYFKPKE